MINFLEFKDARCKDCYKCLRECYVKAIEVVNHHAQIIDNRCILCGKCTEVCPQNAKRVHTELEDVKKLLNGNVPVYASVAPSFASSFNIDNFAVMREILLKLGFTDAEETAIGANAVTKEYKQLLNSGKYKNLITSACPSVNRLIQLYYPKALEYLAPIDSPMIAHAKIIKSKHPNAKIVFIGPCIAKKREAYESNVVDAVLTYEDLIEFFEYEKISIKQAIESVSESDCVKDNNKAKYYPISRGIIKSFDSFVDGYEFVAVDGASKCMEVLNNIDSLSGMFLELNTCEYACVNGPCSLIEKGSAVNANAHIRKYANKHFTKGSSIYLPIPNDVSLENNYKQIKPTSLIPTEEEITAILAKTGKTKAQDELNCGACGYATCREKAWAVTNGYADIEMCVPYMRERAESMSYEIIQNSPNGIMVLDSDLKILEINAKAISLLGITDQAPKGNQLYKYLNPADFVMALVDKKNVYRKKVEIAKSKSFMELTIVYLSKQKVMFGFMKDITEQTAYDNKLTEVKLETLKTTDEVIKKQMRVAQEIASLLGETTAETKVALVKLKKTLQEENRGE